MKSRPYATSTNKMATTLAGDIEKLKEVDKLKDEFIDIAAHNFGTPIPTFVLI